MSNPLKDAAMLVRLTRRKPNANCHDRKQSEKLQDKLNVKMKNGVRVMKTLFSKEFTKGYSQILNDVGTYFYRHTLPWNDKGYRLLPSVMFDEFSEFMRTQQTRLDNAINTASDMFNREVERAEIELGDAFNRDDYPSLDEFRDKFVMKLDYDSITDGDDFRTNISEHQRQAIVDQINSEHDKKVRESNEYLFNNLYDIINDLAETLSDPTKIYRDSKVSNVIELCGLLPKLNVHNDPNLVKLADSVLEKVQNIDPESCRKDLQERSRSATKAKKAAEEVKDVMADMDGYF